MRSYVLSASLSRTQGRDSSLKDTARIHQSQSRAETQTVANASNNNNDNDDDDDDTDEGTFRKPFSAFRMQVTCTANLIGTSPHCSPF